MGNLSLAEGSSENIKYEPGRAVAPASERGSTRLERKLSRITVIASTEFKKHYPTGLARQSYGLSA